MKESSLINSILRVLPKSIHSQSMTFGSLSQNGTPDRYFDGIFGDLWVEFKQLSHWPRDRIVGRVDAKKRGCYSPNQFRWMSRRYENGFGGVDISFTDGLYVSSNVLGVIGTPDGQVVIQTSPEQWESGSGVDRLLSRKRLADLISLICTGDTIDGN